MTPHFFAMRFAFTVWTLTRRLPMGILSLDSRMRARSAKVAYWFCVRSRSKSPRTHDLIAKPLTPWRIMRSSAGRKVVRFGANHVGRDRCDASDPAVVHITGTRRRDYPWRHPGLDRTGPCRRFISPAGALDLVRF